MLDDHRGELTSSGCATVYVADIGCVLDNTGRTNEERRGPVKSPTHVNDMEGELIWWEGEGKVNIHALRVQANSLALAI